jgi:hypothetical protein
MVLLKITVTSWTEWRVRVVLSHLGHKDKNVARVGHGIFAAG